MFTRPDQVNQPLYVVTVVFNAMRYRTRWKLYLDFERMVRASGAKLLTVEVAFGRRQFVLKETDHDYYLPLRTEDVLWHKERALNLGFAQLPSDWQYAAHIDADISFARGDWANEIVHQLQHHKVLQIFSESVDLSPDYEILHRFRSYAWCIANGMKKEGDFFYYTPDGPCPGTSYFHPGYGLAFRREAFNHLGGLIDFAVLGGGDLWMLNCLFDHDFTLPRSLGPSGQAMLKVWKQRADMYIKQDIGFLPGLILHYFHGRKRNRRYNDRGSILTNAQFDPIVDLIPDSTGLWQLNPLNTKLRDGIRNYMKARNEDSIDI